MSEFDPVTEIRAVRYFLDRAMSRCIVYMRSEKEMYEITEAQFAADRVLQYLKTLGKDRAEIGGPIP